MHKYFIEIYRYNEKGSLESRPFTTETADNELQLRKIRDRYAYEMQTVVDENGEEKQFKAYKVVAYMLQYKQIENLDAVIDGIFGK